jgi:hypothetical protein
MNFEIAATDIEFAHLNVRSEKHGEEDVTAVDLKLVYITSHDVLKLFHPTLPALLYEFDRAQQVVEGASPVMTARAFPALSPLKWNEEVTGLQLTIEHGLSGKSDIVLKDCTADHFVIEALDGGSVMLTFRLRTVCTDERILGKLGVLIKRDLPMAIKREHEVNDAPATTTNVKPIKATKPRKQQSVEDAFMESE